ncbi:hypothetical protein RM543_09950 [Roseicyclus sp. F158]|uniref:Uncharacterized protein n=1 Tax=Tropicimonas omnivorans TaxID=3075590 RepID=A0ABU3DH53_9RHOB|nr:hypothetical protein [Roseicyclus sp. F158]MDT0683010.1 hypothetical protein [Roseicyclus sp. F158]
MVTSAIRRIQIVSFALSHIPLAAVVAILLRDGSEGDWALIGGTFLATLITAVLLLTFLNSAVKSVAERPAATARSN